MAKSDDILKQIQESLTELNKKVKEFTNNQSNMIENYDILLNNQIKTTDNHDIVVQNQKKIIQNQGIITHNQSSIIHNQSVIVKNQAYLKTLIFTQTEVLSLLTNRPKDEIAKEVEAYLQKAQKEIAEGFEEPIGG
jgi:Mg2+ and Co2+ transporter CorA